MTTVTPSLLLVCSDLMLGSKVTAAARAAEFELTRTLSQTKAFEKLEATTFDAIVVDLEIEPLESVKLLLAAGDAVPVAFVSHVRTDLIAEARAAGWNVLTRGQMASSGPIVLRQIRERIEEKGVDEGHTPG